ncbi:MAG: hypothetical protein Kow0022_00480 [Phycisphaerales bacterium]
MPAANLTQASENAARHGPITTIVKDMFGRGLTPCERPPVGVCGSESVCDVGLGPGVWEA